MSTMAVQEQTLFGTSLEAGRPLQAQGKPWYIFQDAHDPRTYMAIDEACASRHILLLGGTGSGKTNVINWIFTQARRIPACGDTTYIVFDTKGDYVSHRSFYYPAKGDLLVGNSRHFRRRSAVWNVFAEVLADGRGEQDIDANAHEIAKTLFDGRGSQMEPFFVNAAADVFAGILIYYVRRYLEDSKWIDRLNNDELTRTILGSEPAVLAQILETYPDTRGLVVYFGNMSTNQGMGVISELRSMVRDCFHGVFAAESRLDSTGLSVRGLVRAKGGRALFVEYDLAMGMTLQPIYRLLLDLALKEALGSDARGHTVILLDELRLLPELRHLEDALNFGRSKGVSVVAGLQSVEQLDVTYGQQEARTILGAFGSLIAMRSQDPRTLDYVSERFGRNVKAYRYDDWNGQAQDRERDGYVVEPWRMRSLGVGEAVVGLVTQDAPFVFHFQREGS